jgi:antitoxin component of RelBE/YafQ-DinJ toxin-antitoxin module
MKDSYHLHIKIDKNTREKAEAVFDRFTWTIPEVVSMFLEKVGKSNQKRLPLIIRIAKDAEYWEKRTQYALKYGKKYSIEEHERLLKRRFRRWDKREELERKKAASKSPKSIVIKKPTLPS